MSRVDFDHKLDITFSNYDGECFNCTVTEPESGLSKNLSDVPVDHLDTFLDNIKEEIASWVYLWKDEADQDMKKAPIKALVSTYEFTFTTKDSDGNEVNDCTQFCSWTEEEAIELFEEFIEENGWIVDNTCFSVDIVYNEYDARVFGDAYNKLADPAYLAD